ncbi:hypothetical protein NM208_g6837 [Fusarium decemcellulare]|uniref:Uncharacterized protein n=1 Tax=Fusarium decemcellulare TaxID=57161 RepID=A0ACC1SBG8_9HYPO|nr:hypothetical protein NM208_g6837 [Fusarium decemcellulare]
MSTAHRRLDDEPSSPSPKRPRFDLDPISCDPHDDDASDTDFENLEDIPARVTGSTSHLHETDADKLTPPNNWVPLPDDELLLVPDGIEDDSSSCQGIEAPRTASANPISPSHNSWVGQHSSGSEAAARALASPASAETEPTVSPTIMCQLRVMIESYDKAASSSSDNGWVSGQSLCQSAASTQQPVGPMPRANLRLRVISAQITVGISCRAYFPDPICMSSTDSHTIECGISGFHDVCDSTVEPTLILARGTFQFKDQARSGSYSEQLFTSISEHAAIIDTVDEILQLDVCWRTGWQTILRDHTRDVVHRRTRESCRSFNEVMLSWLAARLIQGAVSVGEYTCRDCYDDYFLVEDEIAGKVCQTL